MDVLVDMLQQLSRFPARAPSGKKVANLELVLIGDWKANDLLECMVDETSTSQAAGSGTDRALGMVPAFVPNDDEEKREAEEVAEQIIRGHLGDTSTDLAVHRYLETVLPSRNTGAFRKLVVSAIRRLGY